MRTIIVGGIVFALWSTFSVNIYVCKIQGFCSEPIGLQSNSQTTESKILIDTSTKVDVIEQAELPEHLVNYFEFDKSTFKVNDLTKKYIDESNVYLKQYANAMLIITGHTDDIGTEEYNQKLGYRRSQNTREYFVSLGIPAEKISIESKGEIQPADDNSTKEGRANNRRTEITINK